MPPTRLAFEQRASLPNAHPLTSYLCELIAAKKTNLCLSADVTSSSTLLKVAEEVGDYICVFKTHADMIDDFGERTIRRLNEVSKRKKFLIFEDRKFGDIGTTVQKQYTGGPLRIADWAHIVNAHIFPGPAIVTALKEASKSAVSKLSKSVSTEVYAGTPVVSGDEHEDEDESKGVTEASKTDDSTTRKKGPTFSRKGSIVTTTHIYQTVEPREGHRSPTQLRSPTSESAIEEEPMDDFPEPPMSRGLLLLAQMSSAGNMMDTDYTKACVEAARTHKDFVMGYISQQNLNTSKEDAFLCMTPGVNLPLADGGEAVKGDALGQQYRTPHKVIVEEGVDIVIVGRGILNAMDRSKEAKRYRDAAWKAYMDCMRR